MNWLRIHVSNLCNFKCPNCHVFELGENNLPNRVMSQEVFNQTIDQFLSVMKNLGHKETMISIYGGETMANKKVIKDGVERYGNVCNGMKLHWVINTNGSLLKEEDIIFFKEKNVEVHISVDGTEEIHNISRPTHKGKGTFHMVVPSLELVKKHKAPAQINSYMMPSNYRHLKDIVDIAASYGIRKIYLDQFYNTEMISHQVGMDLYRQVFYYGIQKGVAISGPWGRVIKRSQSNESKRESLEKKLQLDVNIDGTFYFPVLSGSKKTHREIKDLTTLIDNGLWKEMTAKAREYYDEKCDGCSIKEHCYGSAIEQVHYHIGEDADPAVSCNFFRDWCTFLLRPVYLQRLEKIEVFSMIDLDKIEPMTNEVISKIAELEKKLWPLKEKIVLNISEYPEELRITSGQFNLPDWVRATTSHGNTLHHLGTKLTPALVHELTHLFVSQRRLKMPDWFVEGLCELTQDANLDEDLLKTALKEKNLFTQLNSSNAAKIQLIDLDQNLPFKNPMYIQAKGFVSYLKNTLGDDNFRKVIESSADLPLEESLINFGSQPLESHIVAFQNKYLQIS